MKEQMKRTMTMKLKPHWKPTRQLQLKRMERNLWKTAKVQQQRTIDLS